MRLLTLALLVGLAAAPLALAPTASAHTCRATDPERYCGDCSDGQAHQHEYWDGSTYCASYPLDPLYVCVDVSGIRKVCVTVESLAALDLPVDHEIRLRDGAVVGWPRVLESSLA